MLLQKINIKLTFEEKIDTINVLKYWEFIGGINEKKIYCYK